MPATLSPNNVHGNIPLVRVLDTVGDGSGSIDMSLNFLVPTVFKLAPPKGSIYYISQIVLAIVTSGGVVPNGYGSGLTLLNGLRFEAVINNSLLIIPQFPAFKTNYQLSIATNKLTEVTYQGNDRGFSATLDFLSMGAPPLIINGDTNDEIRVTVQDDFTSRVLSGNHNVSVCGSSLSL